MFTLYSIRSSRHIRWPLNSNAWLVATPDKFDRFGILILISEVKSPHFNTRKKFEPLR